MTKNEHHRPVVALDFDGVMNKYHGWKGENTLYKPQTELPQFIKKVYKHYDIIIYTCRDIKHVYTWLEENKLRDYITSVTNLKPRAHVYIDDRAITYKGDYDETYKQIKEFKAWWE